jgi:hypothetical protein
MKKPRLMERRGSFVLTEPLQGLSAQLVARNRYLAVNGLRAEIVPSVPMHTDPLAVPGSLRPLPVSEVTLAVKLSAVGLLDAFFTYPGHFVADVVVNVGAPIVVLPPDSHVMVPPVARVVEDNGCEPPPVLPP